MALRFLLAGVLVLAFASPASAQTAADGVTLHPGDVLRIEIWREEDLSGEFQVDQAGNVTLPMLGIQEVAGIPFSDLRDHLLDLYRRQLRNPSISITPLRRVNVLGEVNKPGLYPVDPTISLAGAVALAGGATPAGDLRRIRVVRQGEVVHRRVAAETQLNSIDIRSGDQIFVERRGWFDRNSVPLVTTTLSILGGIITTLIIINNT